MAAMVHVAQASAIPADRRAHRRIPSIQLPGARIRIPSRPAVSLLDLSAGGALIELPFQAMPRSRWTVELHTSIERVEVPFQLLRCCVAHLEGGIRYHAAGVFDQLLTLPSEASTEQPTPSPVDRLIASLDRLWHAGQEAGHSRRDQFHELLAAAVAGLQRGESVALVTLKVKTRLSQRYPSLTIAASQPFYRAAVTSAEFFGLTFQCRSVLSADDRRFLRASAQLISMMEECARQSPTETPAPRQQEPAPLIVHSGAEWMAATSPHSQEFR